MSYTPRTDKRDDEICWGGPMVFMVEADFARQLERELNEMRASRDIWKTLTLEQRDTISKLRKQIDIDETAAMKDERANDEVREEG